jgi:predicted metal-binding membrane protein
MKNLMARQLPLWVPRCLPWLGFYAAILMAWVAVYNLAPATGPGGAGFATLFAMWALMMAAMMLPTIIPTLRAFDQLPARVGAGAAGWGGIVVGYGAVWLFGAAVFAAVQVLAIASGLATPGGVVASPWAASALFALAGGWQFSRTKTACQSACMTPLQYFFGHWRAGFAGGARMGLGIGINCVGCCWAIMALALVGGVMNLGWMGLATLFMVAEKLPEIGAPLRKPVGLALLGAAGYMALKALGWI